MDEIVKVIPATSCPEAWVYGAEHLLSCDGNERYNLTLAVDSPFELADDDKAVCEAVDDFLVDHDQSPLSTVAGTIFPANHYLRGGKEGVYDGFPEDFALADKKSWGTYAMRMLRVQGKSGEINPLKEMVEKIQRRPQNGRSFYEQNVSDMNADLAIYHPWEDYRRGLGQPCLSHLSFKIYPGEKLSLTVMYRSHYYTTKAMGNLIGLSQLQYFVAKEAGLGVGPLVCHSSHARIDTEGARIGEIRKLVATCREHLSKRSHQGGLDL